MINLTLLLNKRMEPSSYGIVCIDNRDVEIAVNNRVERIKKDVIIEYVGVEPCLTTRLINVFKPVSGKEMDFLIFIARITGCLWNTKIYFLIDDSTDYTMEIASLVNNLVKKYGVEIFDLINIDLESTYIHMKNLEKNLEKYIGISASTYGEIEELSLTLQEINKALMRILDEWGGRRHVVEALIKLVRSKSIIEPMTPPNEIIKRFYDERMKEVRDIVGGLASEFFFVNLSSLTSAKPVSFRDALFLFDSYMRRQGCRNIVVIDGEEYEAIVKLLRLNWRVIVPPIV